MEEFVSLFGQVSLGTAVTLVIALVFLYKTYTCIRDYIIAKHEREKKRDEDITTIFSQISQYTTWHQQSLDIQSIFRSAITELTEQQKKNMEKLEEIETANKMREQNKLRDRLIQAYTIYTSTEKNPMLAWSEMEAEAFWSMFQSYELVGGNGYIHSVVEPAMRLLEKIPMDDSERLIELMRSRK